MDSKKKQPADFIAKEFDKSETTKSSFQNKILMKDIDNVGIYSNASYPQEQKTFFMKNGK